MDGHNSHYTVTFLLLACLHMVIVICYVAHGTHVYQGLDVVVFAVLKHYLNVEQYAPLCTTGNAIDKGNFLQVIPKAYMTTLTPELIKTAFCKTGISSFNPNVITADMLAPSLEPPSCPYFLSACPYSHHHVVGPSNHRRYSDSDADVISRGQWAGPSSA